MPVISNVCQVHVGSRFSILHTCYTYLYIYQCSVSDDPNFEEGVQSQIEEDEFYDAVENVLDVLEEEQQYWDCLKQMSDLRQNSHQTDPDDLTHPLWPQIDEV